MADIHDNKLVVVDSGVLKKVGAGDTVKLDTITLDSALYVSGTIVTSGDATIGGNATVTGNLTVNGTTTTVNSTTVTIDDPIFTLGGDTAPGSDDNKDRGIEFRYHDGSSARIGFMGWDDSASGFTLLSAATNNSEVFSGTAAPLVIGALTTSDITLGGSAVNATAAELNILDGGTSASSITVADADRLVLNDDGTMKQVAMTDFETYFESALDTLSNVTTVGALNAGSITSGFGAIDNGASNITTTGLISGGSLDIDDVVINGTTIGHTDDTDLITLADGIATVAGEISVTTLDIGGTNVTATATEINLLDGSLDQAAPTTAIVDADRFIINDNGTMTHVSASVLKSYISADPASSVAADNVTLGDAAVSIETTSGGIDLSSTGSITLDTDGAVLVEAEDGIGRTFTGYHASSGAQADLNNNLLLSGTILTYGDDIEGTPWALTHAYGGSHTYVAGVNMSDAAIGDPTTLQATASMNLHVSQGFPTYVRFRSSDLPLSNTDQGQLCYLGQADYGLAQMDVPSAGNIVRLGILMSSASNGGLYQVLWQPQFIASL
jgi:hypothetical protein